MNAATVNRRALTGLAVAGVLTLGSVTPAIAADIVDGDAPVVVNADQSTFGEILEVFEWDDEGELPGDVELRLFGGPVVPEQSPWATTALSFDSFDRVYVALLNQIELGEGDIEWHRCAIRLYAEDGVPLGDAVPVANPDDADEGLWESACTGLALFDVVSAYGLGLDPDEGFVDHAAVRTQAFVYFADAALARVDARTGAVLDHVTGGGAGPFGDVQSLAISAGPAALIDPGRSGVAAMFAMAVGSALFVSVEFDNGDVDVQFLNFPVFVAGAEFDSELNLWIVTYDAFDDSSFVLSLSYADIVALSNGTNPTSSSGVAGLGPSAILERAGESTGSPMTFESTAISGGVLVSDLGPFAAAGIAIVRDAVVPASDEDTELADTGSREEPVTMGALVAGALLLGGAFVMVVGALGRRSRLASRS